MRKEDCFEFGYITKTHGLKGQVMCTLDVDDPEDYIGLDLIYLEAKQGLVPYVISNMNLQADSKAILTLEGINKIEEAEPLKGRQLYLPLTTLPSLAEDKFYFHEIEGYTVHDTATAKDIGQVINVYEFPQQDMLAVECNGVEVLIPLNDSFFQEIDKQSRILKMNLPEGLVDLYTNAETANELPDDADSDADIDSPSKPTLSSTGIRARPGISFEGTDPDSID
jgi:16S rRNA processing protein RimM